MAENCLFCRIVAGDLPSDEVASTERTYAFRDIKPALPVHVLIVPREHIVSADTVEAEHGDLLAALEGAVNEQYPEKILAVLERLDIQDRDQVNQALGHRHPAWR